MDLIYRIDPGITRRKKIKKGKKYGKKDSAISLQQLLKVNDKHTNAAQKTELVADYKPRLIARFLDPITYHCINGIILLDKANSKECSEMDFSASANLLGDVTGVGIDKAAKVFVLMISPRNFQTTPWRLLHSRLLSLGDSDASSFASTIEMYCNRLEQMQSLPNESPKPPAGQLKLKIGAAHLRVESSYEEIRSFLAGFSNYCYYAFIRKGKTPQLSQMSLIEIIINQNLIDLLKIDKEEFVYNCIRKGFPEFVRPDSYFEFWKSLIDSLMGNFSPLNFRIKTNAGRYSYVRLRNPEVKMFNSNGEFYLIFVISFESTIQLPSSEPGALMEEEGRFTKPQKLTLDEYFNKNKEFFDEFYPNFSFNIRGNE